MTSKLLILYDQAIEQHFPAHYRRVYLESLASFGWDVRLVAPTYEARRPHDEAPHPNLCLVRYRGRGVRAGRLGRAVQLLAGVRGHVRRLRAEGWKPDIVLVHDHPALALTAVLLRRLYGSGFVYRVSHLKPETIALLGGLRNRVTASVSKSVRGRLVNRADGVIAMSSSMATYLSREALPAKPFVYAVKSSVAVAEHDAPVEASLPSGMALEKREPSVLRPRLVYAGNVNAARDLEFVIEVCKALLARGVSPMFSIFGVSQDPRSIEALKQAVVAEGVTDQFHFFDAVPEEELPSRLGEMDIGLSPFPENGVFLHNSPLKTLDYMNAGIPFVGTCVLDHLEIVGAVRAGVVTLRTPDHFADAIQLLLDPARFPRDANVRTWLHDNRSLDHAAAGVDRALRHAMGGVPAG